MEKLKEFLSKNWIPVALVSILVILAVFNAIDSHLSNKANQLVEQTQFNQWKRQYEDSVKISYLKIADVRLDSTKRADSIKTDYHKKRADRLQVVVNSQDKKIKQQQQQASSAVNNYQAGTTTAKCDSAISGLLQVIGSQNIQTDSLKSQCSELDQEAEGYSRQLYDSNLQLFSKTKQLVIKDEALSESDRVNQQLLKQIKKDNNWWHRNEKWFFFGGGAILTGLILK
jgi:hypothetical protein